MSLVNHIKDHIKLGVSESTVINVPKSDGTNDMTTSVQALIDYAETLVQSVWRGGAVIMFPEGDTLITSTLTINQSNIVISGVSADVSIINFNPTADDVCLHFAQSAPTDVIRRGCGVENLGFRSDNLTHQKTAIRIDDVSGFKINNVYIGRGGTVSTAGFWWTNEPSAGPDNCIGIDIRGREGMYFHDLQIWADTPIKGNLNPATATGFTFDMLHISDSFLITTSDDGKCIDMEHEGGMRGLLCENVAMIQCAYGFYHVATTNSDAISDFKFDNCIIEQMSEDGWPIYIDRSAVTPLENLTISNWSGPASTHLSNGFYLDNVKHTGFYEVFSSILKTGIVLKNANTFTGTNSVIGVGKSVAPTEWAVTTAYTTGNLTSNDSQSEKYECILNHTSAAADEPGVGVNWQTYWRLITDIEGMQLTYATGDNVAYTRAVPSNNWNYVSNLGNSETNIDLVTTAQLSDKDHKTNNINKGPQRQRYNINTKLVYTTEGSTNVSPWYPSDGGAAITPV